VFDIGIFGMVLYVFLVVVFCRIEGGIGRTWVTIFAEYFFEAVSFAISASTIFFSWSLR